MDGRLYEACVKYMRAGDYDRAYDCIANMYEADRKDAEVRGVLDAFRLALKDVIKSGYKAGELYELLHSTYKLTAADCFDDFMIALEWYREPKEKFWLVRREKLLPICECLQRLADDKLDELFISQPPRTGKSTIVMFFIIWIICRNPDATNLYSSFSETVVKVFYTGVLEVMADPATYDLKGIFPKFRLADTDAKNLLIDVGRKKRYKSLTCRSIDGTLNGACDVSDSGYIIADDLLDGINEAKNKELLRTKWGTITNNLLSRKKGSGKILWIGTRWSVADPISNRLEMLETHADCARIRYHVINVPALNDKEESNFDYMFKKGFSTQDYKVLRAGFEIKDDLASWLAQFMGTPIERDGAVFAPSDMRYYNGELPSGVDPDRIFMSVDPAWGGGDYTAAPIIYQYGEDLFVHDVVYTNGDKSVSQPIIVSKAIKHHVAAINIEATKTTRSYADGVDDRLRAEGHKINIQTSTKNWAGGTGKAQRIYDKSVDIKERMVFLDGQHRSKDYSAFMQNVFSFTVEGKVKHDDAPDSLAQAITFCSASQKVKIMQRPF